MWSLEATAAGIVAKSVNQGRVRPGKNPPARSGGETIKGYSTDSARRLRAWFLSMEGPGHLRGYAVTLTCARDVTADEWRSMKRGLTRYLSDAGPVCLWRMEWTKKRRPHLHLLSYHAEDLPEVWAWWLVAWARYCPARIRAAEGFEGYAVHVVAAPPRDSGGWLNYVAKHTTKAVQAAGIEAGRYWGIVRRREWVRRPVEGHDLWDSEWYVVRRLLRRIARHRVKALGVPFGFRLARPSKWMYGSTCRAFLNSDTLSRMMEFARGASVEPF